MDGAKSPLQSLTILSAALSATVSLLGACGVTVDPQLAGQAVTGVSQIASASLALLAVYGRLRATTKIGGGSGG